MAYPLLAHSVCTCAIQSIYGLQSFCPSFWYNIRLKILMHWKLKCVRQLASIDCSAKLTAWPELDLLNCSPNAIPHAVPWHCMYTPCTLEVVHILNAAFQSAWCISAHECSTYTVNNAALWSWLPHAYAVHLFHKTGLVFMVGSWSDMQQ